MTTPGLTYLFRYRVKNIYSWSLSYSPTVSILSTKKPDKPAIATTEISGNNVKISWQAPPSNSSQITAYKI
jgi:hypothetical protein